MHQDLTVFLGGRILLDVTGQGVAVDALATSGGRVIATGNEAHELAAQNPGSVVELDGGVLAPAVGDGHAHPLNGGLEALGPDVRSATSVPQLLDAVAKWKADHPEADWIIGGSYDPTLAQGGVFEASWLDSVTGDTPAVLRSMDYHSVWVNSAALALAGISVDSDDPPLGKIVRNGAGEPIGTLLEAAANDFLTDHVPDLPIESRVTALEQATLAFAAQGTTWVQDAWVETRDLEVYLTTARQDRLHARLNLALRADPARWQDQVSEFVAARREVEEVGHSRLTAHTVKFFVDGVIEAGTAAMNEPYSDDPDNKGIPNWTREELSAAATAFDAAGFQLHLHAIGDAANTFALDAIEAAASANGVSERPPVVAHVQLLSPRDVQRFTELRAIANFEPFWAKCDALMTDLTLPRIGHDRGEWLYVINTVVASGATVSFGSDWPVTTLDWRQAMATAITRSDPDHPQASALLPHESVSSAVAYAAYTQGIAAQIGGPFTGTLRLGDIADLVWLSGDPLETAAEELAELAVHGTWLAGARTWPVAGADEH